MLISLRSKIANTTAKTLTWGLKHVAKRPAGNLPGKVALKIDPAVVRELKGKIEGKSIVVVGTNGKTTVTNMLADCIEASGRSVLCNRTGANLKSGIASALLQAKPCDCGVIECDELWLAKVTPDLQPDYVLLLNLFRDQLDRCGEIDRIQESIASALGSSPDTTLIFNADDPLCAHISTLVSNQKVPFGFDCQMHLAQNMVTDASICESCSHILTYDYRQYAQLGDYHCPNCGFCRPKLDFIGTDVELSDSGVEVHVASRLSDEWAGDIRSELAGSYMAYNLLAVFAGSMMMGCMPQDVQNAVARFNPHNGRLERSVVDGRDVLLNLAKNPTGFNQNLRIVERCQTPCAVAFFINDQVVDGHDISWIWDIDFEEIASRDDVVVFAGGRRKNDLQVRLKYAGVDAALIDDIAEVFDDPRVRDADEGFGAKVPLYAIANYSALPPVKHKLDSMRDDDSATQADADSAAHDVASPATRDDATSAPASAAAVDPPEGADDPSTGSDDGTTPGTTPGATPIVIAHVLPELLNLYGDGGNVRILEQRLAWRGIPVQIKRIKYGDPFDLDDVDLVFLGGGPDREQKLATEALVEHRDELCKYIDSGAPLLAICGGYQILGKTWLLAGEEVPGLGILDIETKRPGTSADRLVDNVALDSKIASHPIVGYENHAGRTYISSDLEPFGRVLSKTGHGNNDTEQPAADGVMTGNVLGTYLHGVLLAKNPEVADHLLKQAIDRHSARTGETPLELAPLDDAYEIAANDFMAKRIV